MQLGSLHKCKYTHDHLAPVQAARAAFQFTDCLVRLVLGPFQHSSPCLIPDDALQIMRGEEYSKSLVCLSYRITNVRQGPHMADSYRAHL